MTARPLWVVEADLNYRVNRGRILARMKAARDAERTAA